MINAVIFQYSFIRKQESYLFYFGWNEARVEKSQEDPRLAYIAKGVFNRATTETEGTF